MGLGAAYEGKSRKAIVDWRPLLLPRPDTINCCATFLYLERYIRDRRDDAKSYAGSTAIGGVMVSLRSRRERGGAANVS
jgi:hypothetical protein